MARRAGSGMTPRQAPDTSSPGSGLDRQEKTPRLALPADLGRSLRLLDDAQLDRLAEAVAEEISYRAPPRSIPGDEGGRGPAALAAGPMTAGLVGSGRVRRHPHRRARSAPQCGVSRGPRACRVRVPIPADPSPAPPPRIGRLFGAGRRTPVIRRPPPSAPSPRRYSGIHREGSRDTSRCIALSGRCGAMTGRTRWPGPD